MRAIFTALWILLAAGQAHAQAGRVTTRSFPQTDAAFGRDRLRLDELANQGRNLEAIKLAKSMFNRMPLVAEDQVLLLGYLGRVCTEIGLIGKASTFFTPAEVMSSQLPTGYHELVLFREKAAFSYAVGHYEDAAKAADKAYHLGARGALRAEYSHGIQALALLRLGNLPDAEKAVLSAMKAVPKNLGKYPVYGPRILYAACIVESHAGKGADAETFCNRGLEMVARYKRETRDLSLGYLAIAEAQLQAGDLAHSRKSAQKAADLTRKLFGTQHQDMVAALDLLALISLKQGDAAAARACVAESVKIATSLFGEGSVGAGIPARTLVEIEKSEDRVPR
jgi:tetratricopeptide (TPR) repeat protein